MFYIVIFFILGGLSFCEYKKIKFNDLSFKLIFSVLTLITIIRYGQGTDYFSYMFQYYSTPPLTAVTSIFDINTHGEIGFKLLSSLFRTFHISFAIFIGFIGIITMILIYKFIKEFSRMPITSLTLFYVLYYLVYILSGVRQGLALAVFVGIGLPYLRKEKYLTYTIVILLAATMHASVIITLLIIPIKKFEISYKYYGILLLIGLIMILTNTDTRLITILPEFLSSKIIHYWDNSIPIFALTNRLVMLIIILYFSYELNDNNELKLYKNIYIIGCILFLFTIKSVTISSRISIYMKFLDIIIIPNIIFMLQNTNQKFKCLQLWSLSMLIAFVLLIKTLNAFLNEGDYLGNVNFIRYPYITVFNRGDIWRYRGPSRYLDLVKIIGQNEYIKY